MIVISDITPIISLMKISQLELLEKYFGEIQIPNAVYKELTTNSRFESEAEKLKEASFIHVIEIEDDEAVTILQKVTGLDLGESEAIILADIKKADLLLMDEAKGREVAKKLGIKIMGTVGLLMASYEAQNISADEIELCITSLRKSGRHIGEKYYHMLLEKIGKE